LTYILSIISRINFVMYVDRSIYWGERREEREGKTWNVRGKWERDRV